MRLRPETSWLDPKTYKGLPKETKTGPEFNQAIILLKNIYPAIYSVLTSVGDLSDWQTHQLNPLYKTLVTRLHEVLHTKALTPISAYSPDLPSGITDKSLMAEIEDWHWENIKAFKEIVYKEQVVGKPNFDLPDDLSSTLEKVNKLLSGGNLDDLVIKKSIKVNKPKREKLTFYPGGRIDFTSSSGKVYSYKFSTSSNAYKLLLTLAASPKKKFTFSEAVKHFKAQKSNANSSDERRARDTVSHIRKMLVIQKGYNFLKADYGFCLNCDIEKRS